MLRIFGGAALAATLVFFWGFLFWTVLPVGSGAVQGAPDGGALQAALDAELPASGSYMVPYSEQPESDTAYHEAHTAGPIALIYFRKNGAEPMAPGVLLRGWLHGFATLLLMAVLVRLLAGNGGFGLRFGIAAGGGIVGSVFAHLGAPIWWYQPWDFALTQLSYEAGAWVLGGLVLAALLRSGPPKPSLTQL